MNVIEITGVDGVGAPTVFYISDAQYVTGAGDTPAHTAFYPGLIDPGAVGLNLFADGVTGGAAKFEIGEIVIQNSDGALDSWMSSTYGFDGQPVILRQGDPAGAYPSAMTTIMVGTIDSLEADLKQIVVRLRDARFVFQRPVLTDVYLGNNSLPNGVEGTPDDIKGKVKPRVYGVVANAKPPCVNTSKLTFQPSDRAMTGIFAVYDAGVALTFGTSHGSLAALQAATPAAGKYDVFLGGPTYFRLGSSPVGEVTFDGYASLSPFSLNTSAVAYALAIDAGVPSGKISADFNTLSAGSTQSVGIYLDDGSTTFQEALDQVLCSIGASTWFDGNSDLRVGILTAPSGTPVLLLADYDLIGVPSRYAPDDVPVPAWSVTVNYGKNYTVQNSGLAAGATAARRAFVVQERRSTAPAQFPSIKLQHVLSPALSIDALFADPTNMASDAATEATRLLNLYSGQRCFYKVAISDDLFASANPKFLDVIQLTYARFGMDAGQLFRLVGISLELRAQQVILTLWG